ncbi:SDR family oxidoreductase [Kitasatospora camelliae]|uniref:NAD(P)H-binding protein n=1 Tax=Kitasatospora camelliae TaxID=3156397 RepID=A0AAU8K2Z3_9ACTN
MDTVLVTGGTGHLGREVVELLRPLHRVRVLSRSPVAEQADRSADGPEGEPVEWARGDLATGEGVAEAVDGVSAVVHAATFSPAARRGYLRPSDLRSSPPEVDVEGTRALLAACAGSGVDHFAYVSIVGVDRPRGPYLRLKAEAEGLVRDSGVPWSVLRATQFHWLLDRMLGRMTRLPVLPLPIRVPVQPADAADFAEQVARQVAAGPGGMCRDFGGPEVLPLGAIVDQWQRVRGHRTRVLPLPTPSALARVGHAMTCPDGRRGTTTWSRWLASNPPE